MAMWLRQSTASQEILLGPFLDKLDGDTQEVALTIANTDIKIWKEGATSEVSKNSGGATHMANGRYYAVLDATDTNTLGKMEVNVHVAGALAVRREFMVLPAVVYDAMVLGTDNLDVSAVQLAGQTITAAAGVTFPSSVASPTNITAGTITTTTNLTNLPAITAGWLTAAGIAASALNGKGDWNVGKTGYSLSSAGIQAIWDALTSALVTVGSIGKRIVDYLTGDSYARLGAPAGASHAADIAAVKTETASIQADTNDIQTRLPAALVGGRMDVSLGAIDSSTTTLAAFKRAVKGNVIGTVGVGSTTTSIVSSALTPAGSVASQFKGKILTFTDDTTTAALRGQSTDITNSTASGTPTFTVSALTTSPVSGDSFSIQ